MADIINDLEIVKRRIERLNGFGEEAEVIGDVISLLKEYEPRVLTIGELQEYPSGHVVIQTHRLPTCLPWIDALLFCRNINYTIDFLTLEGKKRFNCGEYGKTWICWTAKPTKAQAEAVKWE